MNHINSVPTPCAFADALQMADHLLNSGPVAKPLLCYDSTEDVWAVVDCMQPDQIAALCWLPDLKPISQSTRPAIAIIRNLTELDSLQALLLSRLTARTEPPYLVNLLEAAYECAEHPERISDELGTPSEPTEMRSDDGGTVSDS